jgi:hypothetical protein
VHFILYTVTYCTGGVELQVNDVIRPGEVGVFSCTVTGVDLRWTVDGIQFNF